MNILTSEAYRSMGRSPGEQAFDRCLFAFGIYFLLLPGLILFGCLLPDSDESFGPPPLVLWCLFIIGTLTLIHWLWALRSVVRAWHDAPARVLRFASVGILFLEVGVLLLLLHAPLRVFL